LTVDDTNTTFFNFIDADVNPPSWAAISPGDPCAYCSAQPQTVSIYDQTWHDGSVGSAGSFTFQGEHRKEQGPMSPLDSLPHQAPRCTSTASTLPIPRIYRSPWTIPINPFIITTARNSSYSTRYFSRRRI
jgi:hypothetical protein